MVLMCVHSAPAVPSPGQSRGEQHLPHPAGCTLGNAPQGPIGPLGHQGSLLAPLANCWPTTDEPWSTAGRLLVNQATLTLLAVLWAMHPRVPRASLGTRAHCCLVVNHWPTVGQPLVNHSQLLVNCWSTVGLPLANCWATVGQPGPSLTLLAVLWARHPRVPWDSLATRAHCWLLVSFWSTTGLPSVNHCPTIDQPLVDHHSTTDQPLPNH